MPREPAYFTRHKDGSISTNKRWWGVSSQGIYIQRGPVKYHRRSGLGIVPKLAKGYMWFFHLCANGWGVDWRLLLATAAAESGGHPDLPPRRANDISYGLCQMLPGTAYQVGLHFGFKRIGMPEKITAPGWREFLAKPINAIALCAGYYNLQLARGIPNDPIALYASYNAGGCYASNTIAWGLHSTPAALDALRNFYNDTYFLTDGATK